MRLGVQSFPLIHFKESMIKQAVFYHAGCPF